MFPHLLSTYFHDAALENELVMISFQSNAENPSATIDPASRCASIFHQNSISMMREENQKWMSSFSSVCRSTATMTWIPLILWASSISASISGKDLRLSRFLVSLHYDWYWRNRKQITLVSVIDVVWLSSMSMTWHCSDVIERESICLASHRCRYCLRQKVKRNRTGSMRMALLSLRCDCCLSFIVIASHWHRRSDGQKEWARKEKKRSDSSAGELGWTEREEWITNSIICLFLFSSVFLLLCFKPFNF